ncbi:hypothetical protein V1477_007952 [Vespula maculifrons]|uniref:Uncharacterized protein n=1 Tax=Vespula maculifrons TaxID=7453 RepID=A0ABD2CGD2_VESMC
MWLNIKNSQTDYYHSLYDSTTAHQKIALFDDTKSARRPLPPPPPSPPSPYYHYYYYSTSTTTTFLTVAVVAVTARNSTTIIINYQPPSSSSRIKVQYDALGWLDGWMYFIISSYRMKHAISKDLRPCWIAQAVILNTTMPTTIYVNL